jgi:hypothetical protein
MAFIEHIIDAFWGLIPHKIVWWIIAIIALAAVIALAI